MDPISHVVLGHALTVRRARTTVHAPPTTRGRGLAITLGALSPDIDLLLMPTGWDRYLAAHEVGTHSIAGALTCGLLAAGLAALIRRRAAYRPLVAPALISASSHVFADLVSGASIRIGWPLIDHRVSNIGVFAMADPVMVGFGLVGALAMWRWPLHRGRVAVAWLCALGLLTLAVTLMRERAEREYREHRSSRDAVSDYLVEPVWGSLTSWRLLDRTQTVVRSWSIDVSGNVALQFEVPLESGDAALIAASTTWDTVRNFRRAHDLAFAVSADHVVEWSDVRYCSGVTGGRPQCGVWAGGEFSTPPRLGRLVVRVGDLVQVR